MVKRIELIHLIHDEEYINQAFGRIRKLLSELYGDEQGVANYRYIEESSNRYLESLSERELQLAAAFNPDKPYEGLKGKIFAICYPDNIYDDSSPTLKTLEEVLQTYFPAIKGIHILPERLMIHPDVWPQDFFRFLSPEKALRLVEYLEEQGVLDENRYITDAYGELRVQLEEKILPEWLINHEQKTGNDAGASVGNILKILDEVNNTHFNDGGFSQKTRAIVDPRFGTVQDIHTLTQRYAVMLDFVVNHLDIDNDALEKFRNGKETGDAFIIIAPKRYRELKETGLIAKTFRPRPFPLFTGLRKHPAAGPSDTIARAAAMNDRFSETGLDHLDERLISFLSIYYKVENDQGLTAEDKRIFQDFLKFLREIKIVKSTVFTDSVIQPQQLVFSEEAGCSMSEFLKCLNLPDSYAKSFNKYDDEIFGEKFFVYTTFSESQVDLNPVSEAGFRMIIDDLFLLLSGGNLAMMRMDAIKYLWKEIGKRNFDMAEGNKLIEIIRLLMALVAPSVLPLDEINSPDPVVYEMGRDGGFSYLFGQVNSVAAAFNEGSLLPLKRFYETMKERCPSNLVLFVMLSTHDGRSVQGLGVQRTDGNVSIDQFYKLKEVVEKRGGKPKYRSVPAGQVPTDTFHKVSTEGGLDNWKDKIMSLFTEASVKTKDQLHLKNKALDRTELLSELSDITGRPAAELSSVPAIDYFLQWIIDGRTPYELCCTSRSAFSSHDPRGNPIIPEHEAWRLALAQLYVLTLGQVVPAIYFNDLLGLENDLPGYKLTGKPRDLNRHKTYLPKIDLAYPSDPFTAAYLPRLNTILKIWNNDGAFYPGSSQFEFKPIGETVFLNHPFADGNHSFILGNIANREVKIQLDLKTLSGINNGILKLMREQGLENKLDEAVFPGAGYQLKDDGLLEAVLPPFGALWLKYGEKT